MGIPSQHQNRNPSHRVSYSPGAARPEGLHQLFQDRKNLPGGLLAGGAGLVEVAVGEFGAESGEGGAGGGAGVAHAHDAEGAGEGVLGDEVHEGDDVRFAVDPHGEFGQGVGGCEHVFDHAVEVGQRRGAVEIVAGDDDGLAECGGLFAEGGAEGAVGFDVDGGGDLQHRFEDGQPGGVGSGPFSAVFGETQGGDDGNAEGFRALDGLQDGGKIGEIKPVQPRLDRVALFADVGRELIEKRGGEHGADDTGAVKRKRAEMECVHG